MEPLTTPAPATQASTAVDRIQATLAGAHTIVFYDGECGLCDGFVQFCLARDKHRRIRYGMQQGETFSQVAAVFPGFGDLSTVIVAERVGDATASKALDWKSGWRYSRYSTAALRTVKQLPGLWSAAGLLLAIPTPLRDWVYKQVARNRYRIFGKVDACRLPTPEERAQFLP